MRAAAVATALVLPGIAQAQPHDTMSHGAMASGDMAEPPTPLGIPDTRDASGTSWQPESTPMFMWHAMTGGWSLGLHMNAFAGYDGQAGMRGDDRFVSINWVMGMARHALGAGDLTVRTMLSLEPATVGKRGYPLLLQTGESVGGEPLHDRQHPHDLFMELAARYRRPLSDALAVELYVAPSGEPAIGPPAFPHRFTAMSDPLAPLGHHWQDSTHISFGVVTAGIFTRQFKLEGSWFNGREPDEDRWDIDLRWPDSVAVRLTVNPTVNTSAQASWTRLDSPEQLEPGVSIQRATASVMWNDRMEDSEADLALTAVFGHNEPSTGPGTDAGLIEGSLMLARVHTAFARAEFLTKTGHDLALPPAMNDTRFGMASLSAGYVFDFDQLEDIVPGIGVVGILDVIGSSLEPFYGTRTPWGGMLFVRLRAHKMRHDMPGMEHEMHGR
jgi:hypothetical protein